jgi:exopolysaccharide biosynthesis predicted pyruvyltransferase EpsI
VAGVDQTVERLRAEVVARLEEVVPRRSRVALLDFPNHPNVGDTAIWLGELAALRELECDIAYASTFSSYSAAALRRRLGAGGVVLLHGGGNFGDVWPTFQAFRERIFREERSRPLVQLPQTIHFAHEPALRRAAEAAAGHPDLVLMVRDERSEQIARRAFNDANVVLAPDSAFALGPLPAPEPEVPLLVMLRTDDERTGADPSIVPDAAQVIDWPAPMPVLRRRRELSRWMGAGLRLSRGLVPLLQPGFARTLSQLANRRMADGVALLARGETLVTNRLHGHIIALLIGRPHVLLDNTYGKNRTFHELWTADSTLTSWADRLEDALTLAGAPAAR